METISFNEDNYRLGDSIRYNNALYPNNSFAAKYHEHAKYSLHYVKDNAKMSITETLNLEKLYNIVLSSDYPSCPENTLVIHLRLHDWCLVRSECNLKLDDYKDFLKNNNDILNKIQNVHILCGYAISPTIHFNNQNKNIDYTVNFLLSLKTYITENYNINCEIITNNTDIDFKYCVTAMYYLPSVGGFSLLAASLNKNTVLWDISDKYLNKYKCPKDNLHIKLFRDNYYKNKYPNNKKAIVGLVRGYENKKMYDSLIRRNKILEENNRKDIDYIIFHQGNIPFDHQYHIFIHTPKLLLQFVNISDVWKTTDLERTKDMEEEDKRDIVNEQYGFILTEKINELYSKIASDHRCWHLGYRNMCNFWFCDFWKYVEKYDKIIRIDEDILLKSDIFDMFSFIENKVACYGKWERDIEKATLGLTKFTINFFKEKLQKDIQKFEKYGPYTNVFGLNLQLLRKNKDIFHFIKVISESNHIYRRRWGDLPLWGIVLKFMYNPDDHILTDDIQYRHGSNKSYINCSDV